MRPLWFCCVVLSLASTAPALAQSRDPAGAEKLYADGEKLRDAGDWAAACAKFEGSLALDPAAGTVLQLFACAEREGKLATAWVRLKEARSINADTKSEKTRREIAAFIDAAIARIEPKLPMLRVDVAGPARAVVTRDGQPVVVASELPVDPGKHTIVVQAEGFVEVRREIELAPGQKETLTIQMVPSTPAEPMDTVPRTPVVPNPKPEPKQTAAPDSGLSGVQVGGLVVGGFGAASLVTSLALGIVAMGKESDLEELGCEPRGDALACDAVTYEAATELSTDGRTFATVSTVTTFVGAAALGAGVLMLALGGGSAEQAVAVVPWGAPDGGGLTVVGRFR
jgi:hypothetical protein